MPLTSMRSLLFLVLIPILMVSRASAEGSLPLGPGGRLALSPEPAWITSADLDVSPIIDRGEKLMLAGFAFRLIEQQYNFIGADHQKYERMVIEIGSPAILEQFSVFTLSLYEDQQTILIHGFRVWRDGKEIDLSARTVTEVQKSSSGTGAGYATDLTSIGITIPDLRVGDLLDIAYSTLGVQPGLEHQRNETLLLARLAPVRRLIASIKVGIDTPLYLHALGGAVLPEARRDDSSISYFWDFRDIAPIDYKTNAPNWYYQIPSVILTSADDWGDIAAWARPYFTFDPAKVDFVVAEKARALTKGLSDEKSKFEAIIAFVQGDIRYIGPGLSRNGFRPFPPQDVLDRGWGDCKDKSMLALTMLDAVGIKARAALTNISSGSIDPDVPTISAFDHVIVLAEVNGETRWIDTTTKPRGPTLPSNSLAKTNFVLPIDEQGGEIVALEPERLTVAGWPDIDFFISLDLQRGKIGTISISLTGSRADLIREMLKNYGNETISKILIDFVKGIGDNLKLNNDLDITDNYSENIINISNDISAIYFWKKIKNYEGYHFYSRPDRIKKYLPSPVDDDKRQIPYAIDYPLTMREVHSLSLHPKTIEKLEIDTKQIERSAYTFLQTQTIMGNRLIITTTFKTLRDHLTTDEIGQYNEDYEEFKNWKYYLWTEKNNPFKDIDLSSEPGMSRASGIALDLPEYVVPPDHIIDKEQQTADHNEEEDKPDPPNQ